MVINRKSTHLSTKSCGKQGKEEGASFVHSLDIRRADARKAVFQAAFRVQNLKNARLEKGFSDGV